MPRKTVSAIMVFLLVLSMLALVLDVQPVRASGTIYIRADGSIDPPTAPIQRDGDIYTLADNINSDADGIVIERGNMTLDGAGYTLQGTGALESKGITLSERSNVTIKNIEIASFTNGIYLFGSSNCSIVGNNIANNGPSLGVGIWIKAYSSSSYNSIVGNNITNNSGNGIWILADSSHSSSYNSIVGNNITNNGHHGIGLYSSSYNSIVGNKITNNSDDGIFLYSDCYPYIGLHSSSYNSIVGNNITNNDHDGIHLWSNSFTWCSDNSIVENEITNNRRMGIYLYAGGIGALLDVNIVGNKITNNSGNGIGLYSLGDGIGLYSSIVGNKVTNSAYGIYLYVEKYNGDSSHNIVGNKVTNNGCGICLGYGSPYNFIYHNDFANNTNQAYTDGYEKNNWDDGYPSGGNYWSDYTGLDLYHGAYQNETGSDGIGDAPYIIDAENRDNCPLMKAFPWSEHDIGITYIGRVYSFDLVVPLKTIVGLGFSLNISTFVMNYGSQTETFNVQVYANDTLVGTFANVTLASRQSTILSLRWNTTGFAYGNYTVKAVADNLSGETDISDNAYADGTVYVGIPGDVNGDGKMDMRDIGYVAKRFGTDPHNPIWDPNADLNDDEKTDMLDIGNMARHFGEHYP